MAVIEIPLVNNEPRFKIRTILDDLELVLKFDWNDRAQRYQMSIYDSNESALIEGICLNVDTELLKRFTIDGVPKGHLVLYDTSGLHEEAGIGDLGDRCKLVYKPAE
jgi:hypothetical protein